MKTVPTLYGEIAESAWIQAAEIKLLICDVDGVFSDGRIYLGNDGEELKAFHTKDGFGVKSLINAGIDVAIITGRKSTIVENRMTSLGVKHIYQGQADKYVAYQALLKQFSLAPNQVAYIGDDMVDKPVMDDCGLGVAVNDAHPALLQNCDYVTFTKGGFGAVREVSDLILASQGILAQAKGMSV
ncbi:3-deoxy-manno-octulosonate-8-phosphatase KdsC [Psychrobium sp. 1_MG-2023]|uniref:3-deoxy-manno-octulosonate-8-phosphatase KdsC n=1 Tax=Psychrobium sp. 1_MG-2023 TaxID=3062624 RepID=UPI000C3326F3|nr:3-deoxy-manno-octulosonate-8-phosphatase KdsC [Psychrobium sp. 1_MG-2023]MDP2560701.1 3-deoxy-manno-octulosonate-8-phosphatase KdsC [Psychrobium sp. 1_MG-2023]PKF56596.1 3-deoxy-manno-octulosonate-8-phosphatase KdsC [Alteromonadales bacterium alter-6D02]